MKTNIPAKSDSYAVAIDAWKRLFPSTHSQLLESK
jgi:hypothetical protein